MNRAQKIVKYIAIVLAISLIVSIVGSILTGIFAFLGISTAIDILGSSVETIDYMKEYTNINSIEIEVQSVNLEIVSGDILKVEGNIPASYKFKEENGALEIDGKSIKGTGDITIYIPEEVSNLSLETGAGDIQIKDVSIKTLDLETGASKTNIDNVIVTNNAKIETGVGETTITNTDISNLDMDAGVGNVEYNGYLRDTSNINCGVGNIELTLLGTEELYTLTTERGIGNLNVNGKNYSGIQTFGNGINKVKLSGGIGNLSVVY